MAKRALWFGLGAASGCFGAVWGLSSVRRATRRLNPDRVPTEMAGTLLADNMRQKRRSLAVELRGAVAEGREAMHARQDELQAALRREPPGPRIVAGEATAVRYPGER